MSDSIRDKIREELNKAKQDNDLELKHIQEKVVVPPSTPSVSESIRQRLEELKRETGQPEIKKIEPEIIRIEVKDEPDITIEKNDAKKKKGKKDKAKVDPEEETRDSVDREVREDGTTIEENGDDLIYTLPDDNEQVGQEMQTQQDNMLTPAESDSEGFKSEIAKQLFDVPRSKILQRTELPRRMILPMSMMKTSIFLTTKYYQGKETGPEFWMNEYGYLMLSAGRKVRMEGMAAFQPNPDGGGSENINF